MLLERFERNSIPVDWAPAAPLDAILEVHPREYLDMLASVAAQGGGRIEADTVLNSASWDAALGAAHLTLLAK